MFVELKTKLFPFLLFAGMIMISFNACGTEEECESEGITYTNFVGPLFDASCSNIGCHLAGAPMGSLATYEDAVVFVSFGRIEGALNHEEGFSPMPKNGEMLSECEIEKIEAWIADGTPE